MWAEYWGLCPFFERGTGPPSNTIWPGPRSIFVPSGILIHPTDCPQQTWAENCGLCLFFWGGGTRFPSNTMWPEPRPTSVPSGMLIHPTVCPQYTNVTDRADGTDRQWSDSIGRTVLQTVAQELRHCHPMYIWQNRAMTTGSAKKGMSLRP